MKSALKQAAFWIATAAIFPALVSFWIRAAVLGRDRALEGSTQALSLAPGLIGHYVRRAFLARVLAGCHPTVTVEFGTVFSSTRARLDENVYVGPRCHLGFVHLSRDVLVGAGVHIPSGADTHGTDEVGAPIRDQEREKQQVTIGRGAWIGSAAVVMADVGPDSVVGAGAVVTRPVPGSVVAAGVPARVIRQRSEKAGA